GREYVLRRIARRAIRYGRRLGIERSFLADLVDAVVERMGPHYPELKTEARRIKHVLGDEEELFDRTLQAGSAAIERLMHRARARGDHRISGERAFDLYQTYGFPVELTEEMLRAQGLELDGEGYEAGLEAERERARARSRFHRAEDAAGGIGVIGGSLGVIPAAAFLAWTEM